MRRFKNYFYIALLFASVVWLQVYILSNNENDEFQVKTKPAQLNQVKRFFKLAAAAEVNGVTTDAIVTSASVAKRRENSALLVDAEDLLNTLENVKIYVFNLPEKFNSEIDKDVRIKHNSCFPTINFGCTASLTEYIDDLRFCFTNQFTSELIFHQRLLTSRYSVDEIEEANLVYLPFYSGLSCWLFDRNRTHQLNMEFWDLVGRIQLPPNTTFFMAHGKVQREMSSALCNLLSNEELARPVKHLLIETEPNRLMSLTKHTIPYPSWYHRDLHVFYQQPARTNPRRDIFIYLAGSRKSGLRPLLIDQISEVDKSGKFEKQRVMRNYTAIGYYEKMGAGECHADRTIIDVTNNMRRSVFCPQPAGDTPTRKSFYDALMTGCIPVIFDQEVEYPYSKYLNYTMFTVYIPEADILQGKTDIFTALLSIAEEKIQQMQEAVSSIKNLLQYSLTSPKNFFDVNELDAIDMALYELVQTLSGN